MGKPLDSPASFRPVSLTSASQSFLNASFYLTYSSIWSLTPFSLSARMVSGLDDLLLIKFFSFLSLFQRGFTNPSLTLGPSLLLLISRQLSTLSGIPSFFTNSFRLASFLAFFVRPNLSFLIGALAWFLK